MSFGKKIELLRKKNNYTQQELADKIFVSRTLVSKWESDLGYPTIDVLKQLAKIFSVSIDDLLA